MKVKRKVGAGGAWDGKGNKVYFFGKLVFFMKSSIKKFFSTNIYVRNQAQFNYFYIDF